MSMDEIDLESGYLITTKGIKEDAAPIDNVNKFAWADEDYEDVQIYIPILRAEQITNRITELKSKLSATDYAVIKIAEGAATAEEYAGIIADREAWRAEINTLERQIKEANENE